MPSSSRGESEWLDDVLSFCSAILQQLILVEETKKEKVDKRRQNRNGLEQNGIS